jgi:hypothetical protein
MTLRCLGRRKNNAAATGSAASALPGSWIAHVPPGVGILGFRGRTGLQGPQHTARPAKDQSTYSLERSEPRSPLHEGEGG